MKLEPPSSESAASHSAKCMEVFRIFGDKPTLAIMFFVSESPKRFKELERLTEVNPVTLTARLKRLTEQNIIMRTEREEDKQSVAYSLGDVGCKMLPTLKQMEQLAKELPSIVPSK
ncbi:MAG: winged helix-turn-helix transcriptional regulator [Candidatus Saccharimonas sp.]